MNKKNQKNWEIWMHPTISFDKIPWKRFPDKMKRDVNLHFDGLSGFAIIFFS